MKRNHVRIGKYLLIIVLLVPMRLVCHAGINVNGQIITSSFTMTTGALNGYVLTSDVSGQGTWQPSSSALLNSTNTWTAPNTWTSTGSFNGNLFVSGNLGVGTLSPSQKLEVKGYSLVTGPSWGAGNQAIMYMGDTNYYIKSIFGSGLRIGSYLSTDAISVLENQGGIGFWTTTPNEAVTVNGRASLVETSTPSATAGFGKLYVKSSDSQLWFLDDGGTAAQLSYEYAVYEEQYSSGTNGGNGTNFVSGAWQTRILNATSALKGSSISRAGNTITLSSGTYHIVAIAPAHRVRRHKTRFYNSTDGIVTLYGTTEYVQDGLQDTMTRSFVDGIITISASKSFILQHRCGLTRNGDGYGLASGFGDTEVYAKVYIQKIN